MRACYASNKPTLQLFNSRILIETKRIIMTITCYNFHSHPHWLRGRGSKRCFNSAAGKPVLRAKNKEQTTIPTSFLVSLEAGRDILLPTGHFDNGVCIQKVAKINFERISVTARISSACISRWLSLFSAAGVIQCRVSTASLWSELKGPGG